MRKLSYWALFNVIVATIGVTSILVMELIGERVVRPGEDFVEPIAMLAGILFFGLLSNVALVAGTVRLNDDEFRGRFWRVLKWCSGLATAPVWLGVLSFVLNRK